MNNQQITEVIDRYTLELAGGGFKPTHGLATKSDHDAVSTKQLGHAAWMCEQVKIFVEEDNSDKANLWLGFVQGVMWCTGFRTVGEMREHNGGCGMKITSLRVLLAELRDAVDLTREGGDVFTTTTGVVVDLRHLLSICDSVIEAALPRSAEEELAKIKGCLVGWENPGRGKTQDSP